MLVEDHETTNGWPLGLGNLNIRIRVIQNLEPAAATERSSLHTLSSSFSSFLSSDLDTELNLVSWISVDVVQLCLIECETQRSNCIVRGSY
ncbi:uncharacterized protein LOC130794244 isoform X2 [Actinidia eriantha]|uniref:uncharacterized protein LOC130794244 isoform X2 n=1 Tax=Actinidia eriantha TaxID=165200 RepID=UPI00258A0D83|nr:uncharacterized protein LOC130794244 isoform X2 [Actinidia eriantha]